MQDSAQARSAVASTITLSRREKAAERARQRYAKTRSHTAFVKMREATLKALRASPFGSGSPASKPSDAQGPRA